MIEIMFCCPKTTRKRGGYVTEHNERYVIDHDVHVGARYGYSSEVCLCVGGRINPESLSETVR